MKKRSLYLDILRILACFMVIANHTNSIITKHITSPSLETINYSWYFGLGYMSLSVPAVTIFLMISGALLLKNENNYRKNFSRIVKIILVIAIFSALYEFNLKNGIDVINFFKLVSKQNVTNAFWYLYMYLGILIMLPILQRLIPRLTKKDYLYFFLCSFLLCSFSFVMNYNKLFSIPIFATNVGIFILGYFADNYFSINKFKPRLVLVVASLFIIGTLFFVGIVTYYMIYKGYKEPYKLLCYDNIFYIFISFWIFTIIKLYSEKLEDKISTKAYKIISYVASCTFGIYLLSDYVISHFSPLYYNIKLTTKVPVMASIIILDILIFIIGLFITSILKKVIGIRRLL